MNTPYPIEIQQILDFDDTSTRAIRNYRTGGSGPPENVPTFDFQASSRSAINIMAYCNRNWDNKKIRMRLGWTSATATTGVVVWEVTGEIYADDTDDLDGAGQTMTGTTTSGISPTVAGEVVYTDIIMDSGHISNITSGDYLYFELARDTADSGDTMSGDAQLITIEILEEEA